MKRILISIFLLFANPALAQNYQATQGSGTTFGSKLVSSVNYPQFTMCDPATPAQCLAVDASGRVTVLQGTSPWVVSQSGTWNITNISGTISLPIGASTSANQSIEITSLATIATNTGAAIPSQSSAIPIGGISICDGANGATNPCTTPATVKAASTASAAVDKALVTSLSPNSATPALTNQYPFGATPITASATGTTAATTATLAGTTGKTTYICGYSIRANATAAATVTNTITGVITATLSSIMWVAPLASGIGIDEQIFSPCIPASATNTGIAIVSGAPGSGGTVSSKGWGYQL